MQDQCGSTVSPPGWKEAVVVLDSGYRGPPQIWGPFIPSVQPAIDAMPQGWATPGL